MLKRNGNRFVEEMEDAERYSIRVYNVGIDIPVGSYTVNCLDSCCFVSVYVFFNLRSEMDYQMAVDTITQQKNGAIPGYIWSDHFPGQGEKVYVDLHEGHVLRLHGGLCQIEPCESFNSRILYSGIYIVGKDIRAGETNILCTSEHMSLLLFQNKNVYEEYIKFMQLDEEERRNSARRYEEFYDICQDESIRLNLKEGMVLLIADGTGENIGRKCISIKRKVRFRN